MITFRKWKSPLPNYSLSSERTIQETSGMPVKVYQTTLPKKKNQTNENPWLVVFAVFHVTETFHHDQYAATNTATLDAGLERNGRSWLLGWCRASSSLPLTQTMSCLHRVPFPTQPTLFSSFSKHLWHLKSVAHCFRGFMLWLHHILCGITIISDNIRR